MAKTSKAPSGLTIARNERNFTTTWKVGETYSSQEFWYCIAYSFSGGKPKWPTRTVKKKGKTKTERAWIKTKKISAKATSVTIQCGAGGCAAISVALRGKANGKNVSSFVIKEYIIQVPSIPSVSMSVVNDYTSSFSWSTSYDNKTTQQFVKNEFQHVLITNYTYGAWSGISNVGASGSWSNEEYGFNIIANSYTRMVRLRSIGWAGLKSGYSYAQRVYAYPVAPTAVSASRSAFGSSGYSVTVNWTSTETAPRPIDVVNIEYAKVVPIVTVTTPSTSNGTVKMDISCPSSGVSWTSIQDSGGKSGGRSAAFIDQEAIPNDNCFYVIVANKHDNNITRCAPVLASGGLGSLYAPSKPSSQKTPGDVHNLYTISVTRNQSAQITNTAIAIYFRVSSDQTKSDCIGVIPPGSSSERFILPDVPTGDTYSLGAMSFVGNYTPEEPPEGSDEPTYFEIERNDDKLLMTSELVWGDEVPLPPDITVDSVNETTARVSWTWTWSEALQAELSWSDHEDAWESTSEPTTYIVNNTSASSWNIAGLSVGTWWIRVRLIKPSGDSASYSAYSETKRIKLSSSPDTPSLLLSSNVISKTGSVTCYWAYVSGDGTGQKQAQIFEAFPEYEVATPPSQDANPYELGYYERTGEEGAYKYFRTLDTVVIEGKTYYQTTGNVTYNTNAPLRQTNQAQSVIISAEEFGWLPGETHHLAVKVMSMSGEMSDGYSAPVAVTIAEELKINIASTNMTYVNVPSDYDAEGTVIAYRQAFSMSAFPLTFNIEGFTEGNSITCIIDRASEYHVERPDESEFEGFKGETVLMKTYDTANISITQQDLLGNLDDGADYCVTMIMQDAYGQTVQTTSIPTGVYNAVPLYSYDEVASPEGNPSEQGWYVLVNDTYVLTEDTTVIEGTIYYAKNNIEINPSELGYYVLIDNEYLPTTDTEIISGTTYYEKDYVDSFEIHWAHQAIMPSATVEIDKEHNVTFITPIQPESGYALGDVCDIYRLSADPPELIYGGAEFGIKYVDPYPAFGDFGGIRVVYRTYNGDYITVDNELAMTDYNADENPAYKHDLFGVVIDFDGNQLVLPGNISFSNKWSKDFTMTKYLGGSIQGDWNPAVERTMSAKATVAVEVNPENIELLRRLAIYPGICNIRTPDGSSFSANVNVNDDREEKWSTRLAKISLDITKCDSEGEDGKTYAEWQEEQES